jgi:mono/diheme cytochrome c family protein
VRILAVSALLLPVCSVAWGQGRNEMSREEMVAHGKYLVETIAGCGNCHTQRNPDGTFMDDKRYAGAFVIEEPVFKAYAKNITPDRETGIGTWSEDDIVKAIREGVRPDGRVLGPPMSFIWYRYMSDTDAYSIAAFLKTVPAVHNEVPESTYQIPLPGYGPPVVSVPDVPKDDPVVYGEYLAGPVGHCMDCHTTYVNGQIDMNQLGRGGNVYARPFIYDWAAVSRNITSDPQFGLGAWTDDEIRRAITEGVRRDGTELLAFMPFSLYKQMRDEDLDAVIAYLRSLPPMGAPEVAEE